jgi:multiple sugar transport system substrate-binding protein
MRYLVVPVLFLGLLVAQTRGSSVAQTKPPVAIEYWHVNTESFGGPAVRELVAAFNKAHPDIVVSEHFQPNTYTGLLENLQARMAAKNPPDVAQIGYLYIDYVVKNLPYSPVGDSLDARFLRDFPGNLLDLARRDGKLVGMPYALSNIVTFYNADMLKAAGLDPNAPPTTWDGWRDAARKIKEKTGKPGIYVQVLDDNWSTQAMIESHGGRLLGCSAGHSAPAFDSPAAAGGIQYWSDMVHDGDALNVLWNQGQQAFVAGQVATFITTIAKRDTLQTSVKFDLRATTFPTFGKTRPRLPAGGNALMVFSQAPEKRAAAIEFIKYLESPEALAIWTKGTGYIPTNPRAREALADFLQKNAMERVAMDQTPLVVPWTSFPGKDGLAAEQELFGALQRSLSGETPAATALGAAAQRVAPTIAGEPCHT